MSKSILSGATLPGYQHWLFCILVVAEMTVHICYPSACPYPWPPLWYEVGQWGWVLASRDVKRQYLTLEPRRIGPGSASICMPPPSLSSTVGWTWKPWVDRIASQDGGQCQSTYTGPSLNEKEFCCVRLKVNLGCPRFQEKGTAMQVMQLFSFSTFTSDVIGRYLRGKPAKMQTQKQMSAADKRTE